MLLLYKDIKTEDKKIESYLKQFASKLYLFDLLMNFKGKAQVVSLLVQAGRRNDVQALMNDILAQSEDGTLQILSGSLLKDLFEHGYPEEANDLILYALNVENGKFIAASPYIPDDFFEYAIKVDREKTIALLRNYVESKAELKSPKAAFLSLLAKFAVKEEEKDYVTSHVHLLSGEEIGEDFDSDLFGIYYYLQDQELCRLYYKKMLEKMALLRLC